MLCVYILKNEYQKIYNYQMFKLSNIDTRIGLENPQLVRLQKTLYVNYKPPHPPLQLLCPAPGSLVGRIRSPDPQRQAPSDPLKCPSWWHPLWSSSRWTAGNSPGSKEAAEGLRAVQGLLGHPDRSWGQCGRVERVEGWCLRRGLHQRGQPGTW